MRILGILAGIVLVAGCSGNRAGSPSTPPLGASQAQQKTLSSTSAAQPTGQMKIYVTSIGAGAAGDGYLSTYNADGTPTTPTITGLNRPEGVAVDAVGKIYITNMGSSILTTYTANGTPTSPTILPPQPITPPLPGLYDPVGVAVGADGKIYVADFVSPDLKGTDLVTFTANGTLTTPTIRAGLTSPVGVALDAAGNIYIANQYNQVTTYTANGTPTSPTILVKNAWGVAVDRAGKIYVTQFGNSGANTGILTTYLPNGTPTTPTINGLPSRLRKKGDKAEASM